MKNITAKMNLMLIKAQLKLREMIEDEKGMEVVQMLVLLALGLALIGVFIGFKDTIMTTVNKLVTEFLEKFQ